jgi:cytochrome c-type biogenesis protein
MFAVAPEAVAAHGSLALAIPLAAAAGTLSFFSPCTIPLVPTYIAYVAGVRSGASGPARGRRLTVLASGLFVAGFAAVFISYGALFGGAGAALASHRRVLTVILGVIAVVVATTFLPTRGRVLPWHRTLTVNSGLGRTSTLWVAPAIGAMSGLGWTPCIGPTLGSVLSLAAVSGTAARGSLLATVYTVGLGVPFLVMGVAGDGLLKGIRRHPRAIGMVSAAAAFSMAAIGVLEVSGLWDRLLIHLQTLVSATQLPL